MYPFAITALMRTLQRSVRTDVLHNCPEAKQMFPVTHDKDCASAGCSAAACFSPREQCGLFAMAGNGGKEGRLRLRPVIAPLLVMCATGVSAGHLGPGNALRRRRPRREASHGAPAKRLILNPAQASLMSLYPSPCDIAAGRWHFNLAFLL